MTPADVDLAEVYDAFTYMTLVTLEDLGFCAKGEGGPFVQEKDRLPVNTDGGGLSACHPGMRGLFLLVEAVRQLRGEAPGLQVRRPDGSLPEVAVASGTGAGSARRGRWSSAGRDPGQESIQSS